MRCLLIFSALGICYADVTDKKGKLASSACKRILDSEGVWSSLFIFVIAWPPSFLFKEKRKKKGRIGSDVFIIPEIKSTSLE